MSLGFAAPWALAALAALALPILVHLVRRAEHRVTPFAALRFLRAAGLPRRRIRLAELALLALRMALVAAAVLWLAQPFVRRPIEASRVVAVATEVPRTSVPAALGGGAAHAVWLAPGFPALADPPPEGVQPVSSLLRELDAGLTAGATLAFVVPEHVAGLDGARPVLSRAVAWHVVPRSGNDETVGRDEFRVGWHVEEQQPGARFVAAAVAAWRAAPGLAVETVALTADGAIPGDLDAIVWAGGALPRALDAWVAQGGLVLVVDEAAGRAFGSEAPGEAHRGQRPLLRGAGGPERVIVRDEVGAPLVLERAHGRGSVRRLARPLEPSAWPLVHDAAFPAQLRAWLAKEAPAPTRAVAEALRPVQDDHVVAAATPRTPLAPWLAVAVALLFLVERAWAAGLARRRAG